MTGDIKRKNAVSRLRDHIETTTGDLAVAGVSFPETFGKLYKLCKDWIGYVHGTGNQCAYTDTLIDLIKENAPAAADELKIAGFPMAAEALTILVDKIKTI